MTGLLVPDKGLVRIFPQASATVEESFVDDGAFIEKGEALFSLSAERGIAGVAIETVESHTNAEITNRLRSLRDEIAQTDVQLLKDVNAIQRKQEATKEEILHIKNEIALQERRLSSAQAAAAKLAKLLSQNFVSQAAVDDKSNDILDQEAKLEGLKRNLITAMREFDSSQADAAALPGKAQSARASLMRDESSLRQALIENAGRAREVVYSPISGRVATVLVTPGQNVTVTNALTALVPANSLLEAHLVAPSKNIGFIDKGS